jgi:hypothetical protein
MQQAKAHQQCCLVFKQLRAARKRGARALHRVFRIPHNAPLRKHVALHVVRLIEQARALDARERRGGWRRDARDGAGDGEQVRREVVRRDLHRTELLAESLSETDATTCLAFVSNFCAAPAHLL